MTPLRSVSGPPTTRTVNLADVLLTVRDHLGLETIDAYLFGSRRYRTGSVRSDIDILLFAPRRIRDAQAQKIWDTEPYLDIFRASSGTAQSIVNESEITRPDRESLIKDLDALPLYLDGTWQEEADDWQLQEVLHDRNPAATNANLYELSSALPGDRADIVAICALPEEHCAAARELGIPVGAEHGRTDVPDSNGNNPWRVELVLINSMGSVQAALETSESLRRTKAPHVVLLGLAAGLPGEADLGDVVLPAQICYYEPAKVTDGGESGAPEWKSTNADVLHAASLLAEGLRSGDQPVVMHTSAVLASGEKVVASSDFREKVIRAHRKITAIDMESYGVACAAERWNSQLSVIKGISDFADAAKDDRSRELAAANSARVFHFLVSRGAFRPRAGRD